MLFSYQLPPQNGADASGRCASIGGYDDVVVVKLGGVTSEDRMGPSAVAKNSQQATYARTKKASGCGLLLPWLPIMVEGVG